MDNFKCTCLFCIEQDDQWIGKYNGEWPIDEIYIGHAIGISLENELLWRRRRFWRLRWRSWFLLGCRWCWFRLRFRSRFGGRLRRVGIDGSSRTKEGGTSSQSKDEDNQQTDYQWFFLRFFHHAASESYCFMSQW